MAAAMEESTRVEELIFVRHDQKIVLESAAALFYSGGGACFDVGKGGCRLQRRVANVRGKAVYLSDQFIDAPLGS
jgi:hypothetical protein